jgi:pyruvate dehydrogenase E2 component (dihydrolipoamide acetyltransferase)
MPTDVVMPQMGESIAEGTIVRWIKKVGDAVERDEPLFEISTDKVDAEIPSPIAGVVTEIRAKEGETVPVNSVVAVIGPSEGATPSTKASPAPPATEAPRSKAAPADEAGGGQSPPRTQVDVRGESATTPED